MSDYDRLYYPDFRNFELEARLRRAEAAVEFVAALAQRVKKALAAVPAARGEQARVIGRAWLKASA